MCSSKILFDLFFSFLYLLTDLQGLKHTINSIYEYNQEIRQRLAEVIGTYVRRHTTFNPETIRKMNSVKINST